MCFVNKRKITKKKNTVADQHYWGASAWEIGARSFGDLAGGSDCLCCSRDVAGLFFKVIRNVKGNIVVFCFVYRTSTATSVL